MKGCNTSIMSILQINLKYMWCKKFDHSALLLITAWTEYKKIPHKNSSGSLILSTLSKI